MAKKREKHEPELYLYFRFLWCYLTHIIGIQNSCVCYHSYLSFSVLLEMELSSFLPSGVKWVTAGAHWHWMPSMSVACLTICTHYVCSQLTQPLKEVNINDHIFPSISSVFFLTAIQGCVAYLQMNSWYKVKSNSVIWGKYIFDNLGIPQNLHV
jgi:hypothetical protein